MIHILCHDLNINQQWAYPSLSSYIQKDMKVFVVALNSSEGWANENDVWLDTYSNDGDEYQKVMRAFHQYQIPSKNIHWFHFLQDSIVSFQKHIEQADILVLLSDEAEHMMMTIEDLHLKQMIQQFDGILICDKTASQVIMETYDSTYAWQEEQLRGLNLLHGFQVMSDYVEDSGHLSRLIRHIEQRDQSVFAFGKDGGVLFDGSYYELLGNSFIVSDQDIDALYHAYEDAKSREAYYGDDEIW